MNLVPPVEWMKTKMMQEYLIMFCPHLHEHIIQATIEIIIFFALNSFNKILFMVKWKEAETETCAKKTTKTYASIDCILNFIFIKCVHKFFLIFISFRWKKVYSWCQNQLEGKMLLIIYYQPMKVMPNRATNRAEADRMHEIQLLLNQLRKN